MNGELLRIIDTIHRDKDIEKETLFQGIESALLTAARKKLGSNEEISIRIDRETGDLNVYDNNQRIIPIDLGRIAAQTAKQVIIQKIREAESDVIFHDFGSREKTIVTGTVQRFEGGNIIVNLGKVEGILPRHEQVRGEVYHPGDRIRVFVHEVKKVGPKVRVRLSRTHPEFIQRLFELEVPEIADGIIRVERLVREPGYRTKIAVSSSDAKIDCVGACVGVRGTRIKNIIDELGGEKIDIIRWNEDEETLIVNALKPAVISSIALDAENHSALVIVEEDQLSLAIGKRGQNVRLASKLCGWDINIVTYKEIEEARALEEAQTQAELAEETEDEATAAAPIDEEAGESTEEAGESTEEAGESTEEAGESTEEAGESAEEAPQADGEGDVDDVSAATESVHGDGEEIRRAVDVDPEGVIAADPSSESPEHEDPVERGTPGSQP